MPKSRAPEEAVEPEVVETIEPGVAHEEEPRHVNWLFWGTDAQGKHYEATKGGKKRRVRPGYGGPYAQQEWLDGGEWKAGA